MIDGSHLEVRMSDNPNNNLSAADRLYLEKWMSKVSRSFAVVVAALEEPLSQRLAAAYLICRVIDNIEDCKSAPAWKERVSKKCANCCSSQPWRPGSCLPGKARLGQAYRPTRSG